MRREKNNEKKELTNRAKQAIETRNRIVCGMKHLVTQKGFENTTIHEISEEAGITVGTFYYYFASKEELLAEFLPAANMPTCQEQIGDVHSFVYLVDYYRELVNASFDDNLDIWRAIVRSFSALKAIDQKRVPMVAQIIDHGQKRGEIVSDVSAEEIANMIVLTNHGLFMKYVNEPESIDYPRTALDAIIRLMYTYLTKKGITTLPDKYIPEWA